MGKKGSYKKTPNPSSGSQHSISLREESSGKRQTSVNVKSMLKLEHAQNLAVWAASEASIPSLGAFFGHRLAALGEALGSSPDPSLFPCQRCESILQPGYNCTVRIEKNAAKAKHRRRKPNISTKNNVVYKCHFCSHRNLKRGTPQGHMKELCPPKAKPSLKSEPSHSTILKPVNSEEGATGNIEVKKTDEIASPTTPSVRTGTTLLEGKRRKRNRSGSKKVAESESNSAAIDAETCGSTSNKRKRKSWTSLKEIAESGEHDNNRNLTNITIPFLI
ncbi:uncharacterized protein LOC130753039 isoform X1 [Actinidia eriantha]|uniref:uncharacterized protein LOC130753039 isoform X1 n=1 Tax=Actinidia eriantha TaxID=165200 RepID=UPI0025872459|nr:uncharacterized protein LOC130753039 isoform X1 [Actinidia eriantha]